MFLQVLSPFGLMILAPCDGNPFRSYFLSNTTQDVISVANSARNASKILRLLADPDICFLLANCRFFHMSKVFFLEFDGSFRTDGHS